MPRLPGLPAVEITLRRSARARRVSLRVGRLDGQVTLTLPPRMREAEALAFLRGQEEWLRRALAARPVVEAVAIGNRMPVEGRMLTLVQGTGRLPRIEGESLLIPGDPARAAARAGAFLKALARDRLAEASDRHAATLGRRYTTLTLRDTRSRWGSCTAAGGLMYSWRLIMAPPHVLDYVAAHEVAHLAEMNHSPAFWTVVTRLYPAHATARRWLKAEGATLHVYRFTPGD